MTYNTRLTQYSYTQSLTHYPTTSVGYKYMIHNALVPRDYQCVQQKDEYTD